MFNFRHLFVLRTFTHSHFDYCSTIPVCLIASFSTMYLFGFSINVITLLALVLSIGLVVDDAIVMLENIYRHIESGEKPLIAAIERKQRDYFLRSL